MSLTALLKINDLRSSKLLAGQLLRIPTAAAPGTSGLTLLAKVSAPAAGEKIAHKLNKGETLSEVAEQYGVPLASLMQWNQISKADKVRAGQQLAIYSPRPAAAPAPAAAAASAADGPVELTVAGKRRPGETEAQPAAVVAAAEKKETQGAVVLLSGAKKQPSSEAAAVSYYKVRSGDSLWSISKKLQVSAKELKVWNSLNGSALQVGATLVIRKG